jgi:GntR family transcriptional regulator/MocR family aminotransferase
VDQFPTLSLLDAASDDETLVSRIRRTVVDDVRRGRLAPGRKLPGSRRLAQAFGVHRNTVLEAVRGLEAEGFLVTRAARGTFVSETLPEQKRRPHPPKSSSERAGYDHPTASAHVAPVDAALSFYGGVPDARLVDARVLARAFREALRDPKTLGYGSTEGCVRLRTALSSMLSTSRGVARGPDEILVTSGSQMALDLVARGLFRPGARVAVESLGYRPAWDALRTAGLEPVPIRVDAHGMDIAALARVVSAGGGIAGVVLTPHHQYPTTVTLSAARRLALLELARRERFVVVEDDYDHEFHYEGRPILPLASADPGGNVVYVGTLSKVLAPGLRIGYVAAPRAVVARLAEVRRTTDREGNHVVERALAIALEDGEIGRHARRARKVYLARRDVLVELLERSFGEALSVRVPSGGTALVAGISPRIDVDELVRAAAARGLALQSSARFAFDGKPRPFLRLGFAQLDERELVRAVSVLREVFPGGKNLGRRGTRVRMDRT